MNWYKSRNNMYSYVQLKVDSQDLKNKKNQLSPNQSVQIQFEDEAIAVQHLGQFIGNIGAEDKELLRDLKDYFMSAQVTRISANQITLRWVLNNKAPITGYSKKDGSETRKKVKYQDFKLKEDQRIKNARVFSYFNAFLYLLTFLFSFYAVIYYVQRQNIMYVLVTLVIVALSGYFLVAEWKLKNKKRPLTRRRK